MDRLRNVILVIAVTFAAGGAAPCSRDLERVRYDIKPVPRSDRVDLEIEMRFLGDEDGETVLALPSSSYGTGDLHKYVTDFRVLSKAQLVPTDSKAERVLTHDPDALLAVRYRYSWDPKGSPESAFRPSVDANHFHFFAGQWMVRFADETKEIDYEFRFRDVPKGWSVFSSLGDGKKPALIHTNYDRLQESFIGGGQYRAYEFAYRGDPIHVFINGTYRLPDSVLVGMVRDITAGQRAWFGNVKQPPFVVSFLNRDDMLAGTSLMNSMVCMVDPSSTSAELEMLLAHEMFHRWIPLEAHVTSADFDRKYEWIDEGLVEYFARKLLVLSKRMSQDRFVELVNEDVRELARNPYRNNSMEQLKRANEGGTFSNRHFRLFYLRGALIALNWDTAIAAASGGAKSLSDCLLDLQKRATLHDGALPESEFIAMMKTYGIDAAGDIDRFIVKGRTIPPDPLAFGRDFNLRVDRSEGLRVPQYERRAPR